MKFEMKMSATPNEKMDEIKRFIRSSCEGCTERNTEHLDFHKGLITHYFEARNVQIYYDKKKIIIEIPVDTGYTTINFSCLDFPTFLSSCVKENQHSLDFCLNYMRNFSNISD